MTRRARLSAAARLVVLLMGGGSLYAQLPTPPDAQPPTLARLSDPGPGGAGRLLGQTLRGPHQVIAARDRWALLAAGTAYDRSVVVVQGSARVDTRVEGDVIVVDGDLRLGRGAVIAGRAVAIGGHVYRTPFAIVRGGIAEYPDDRFAARPAGGAWRLAWGPLDSQYGTPRLRLPGFAGFRVAAYSRVDGLGFVWGPELNAGPLRLRPAATWRTHRGVIDPSLDWRLGSRRLALEGSVERTTATADGWMGSDLAAAGIGLLSGVDVRNWYRADRATAVVRGLQDAWPVSVEGWAGVRDERASAAAPAGPLGPGPWAVARPTPGQGFDRPNPVVPTRHVITSAIAGLALSAPTGGRLLSRLALASEVSMNEPVGQGRFTQHVVDWTSRVALFGPTRLESWGHATWFTGDLPVQRWGAVGGPGTLLTTPVLGLRGPRVRFGAARFVWRLQDRPLAPSISLRAAHGAAGDAAGWGPGVTNVGAQLDVGPVRLEYAHDPAARRGVVVLTTTWIPTW